VDAALDHSSHRDRAGGRRITVSTSAKHLVQELQKTVDELAGAPGRPSRSNGGQHHAVVTPRVEASPDRSDFAKLGETIALEQAKQFADGIRSQVAEKSRELGEMNERLMAFGDSLPAAHRKFLGSDSAEDSRLLVLVPNIGCELPVNSDLFPNHDILPDHFLR
jgi:hypothetical protein